ncbi:MAG: hypothetical protein CMF61_00955 [Magnetococcales bacterium]|nr:hypothetical protein [Magnetococcales bacterium]
MFVDGVIYYFPFACKMIIAMLLLALPWERWLTFLPEKVKGLFKSYRTFLAPVDKDEAHKWYFTTARLALSIMVFILPIAYDHFVPEVAGDLRWYIMQIGGLALLTLFFIFSYEKNKKEKTLTLNFKQPFTVWMALITVIFGALTISWGASLPNNWWFFKNLFGYALMFTFALQLRHDTWYRNLIWLLALSVSFNAVLGILQFFNVTDAEIVAAIPLASWFAEAFPSLQNMKFIGFFQQSAPPAGAFANKNLAASFMVMTIPLFAYLMFTAKNNIRLVLSSIAFTLATIFLLYTRSRGSWVSACAVIVFALIWIAINKPVRQTIIAHFSLNKSVAFLTSIIIVLWASSFQSNLGKHGGQNFHSMSTTVSEQFTSVADIQKGELATRLAYNINGVDMLLENPMGVGLGGFHTIYPKYFNSSVVTPHPGYNLSARPRRMHNDMFQAFVELGVIGGLAHLLFFVSTLVMAWKIQTSSKSDDTVKILSFFTLLGIGGMCVNSLGDFPLQMPTAPGILWLLVGVITGLYIKYAEKPWIFGKNIETKLPKEASVITFTSMAFVALSFITYDNYQRREGTLYLKPALGLSRTGTNNDTTIYMINKSMEKYALNPRAREIWGVIYMSYKPGSTPQHKLMITDADRKEKLLEAIKYDPNAQNNLINLAMIELRATQNLVNMKNVQEADKHVKKAIEYGERALKLSYYTPNAPTVLAIAYLFVGKNQEAYNNLKLALERNPQYPPALEYMERLKPLIQKGEVKP